MNSLPIFQIFGSQNSTDTDVVFFVDVIPNEILNAANLCKQHNDIFASKNSNTKRINTNIAVVKDGILQDVFKGTTDELNNALYYTYNLHQQEYDCQITQLLQRDVDLKYLRCARMILSFLTKTTFRNSVKKALNTDIQTKLDVLKIISLNTIDDFGTKTDITEMKKTMAFQLGQTLLLNDGIEVYTKDEVANNFTELSSYLYREENTDFQNLQTALSKFIITLEERIKTIKSTTEYKYKLIV